MLLITEPVAAALYSLKALTPKNEYEAEDFIGASPVLPMILLC